MRPSHQPLIHWTISFLCILPFVFFLGCIEPLNHQRGTTMTRLGDRAGFNVNGPVKSIKTKRFHVTEEQGEVKILDTLGNSYVSFNERGFIESIIFFRSTGDTSRFERRFYEGDTLLIEKVVKNNLWHTVETTVYQIDTSSTLLGYEEYQEHPLLDSQRVLKLSVLFE